MFLQRFTREASNALTDAYSNLVLGDDAGKSARLVLVLPPLPSIGNHRGNALARHLGITFIEVNGRAYISSVAPNSEASRTGVLPRDAVQYAAVVRALPLTDGRASGNGADPSPDTDPQAAAVRHALQCERQGMRVSYDELRHILADGGLVEPVPSTGRGGTVFVSPPLAKSRGSPASPRAAPWKPIPATINVCSSISPASPLPPQSPISLSDVNAGSPRPIVLVLRRTRQRHTSLVSFRLDDECDVASTLVRRLAPTVDMNVPMPDVWDEFVHDGTDWLLGNGSILPPKMSSSNNNNGACLENGDGYVASESDNVIRGRATNKSNGKDQVANADNDPSLIPLDSWERSRAQKLALLRSRMAAEAMAVDRTEDVEAVTIRGMIQKAVGLAFVRASKVVLGVSLHAGTGIVVARLSDGTWSAPSAIGTWGLGLGLQFGLEVAEYIFILQTQESLEHFRRGGSFTIGGNIGAAVAGMGREAYGAASVGGVCGSDTRLDEKDDEYNDTSSAEGRELKNPEYSVGVAPLVAYARSQGLYIGVSLEGSRIFTRDDINHRTYKFMSGGKNVTAHDILSGKVSTPPEAEDLYAALHSVEFTHEMSCLPRPPEILRIDSPNPWIFDRNTLGVDENAVKKFGFSADSEHTFPFLLDLPASLSEELRTFETQFKKFMYGGVSVQRLIPSMDTSSKRTRRERRTLWLMLPEIGSLRLGFVSKLSDEDGAAVSNKSSTLRVLRRDDGLDDGTVNTQTRDIDSATVASEEVTLDSALVDKDNTSTVGQIRTGNVELSNKHSVALTDVTVLSHDPLVPIKFKEDDQTEHLRVISIQDVSGTSLLFLANNFREAELLLCGLKLLLERETNRLGVRGGRPLSTLSGMHVDGAMSPSMARGRRGRNESPISSVRLPSQSRRRGRSNTSLSSRRSGYSSSEFEDMDSVGDLSSTINPSSVPTGWRSWGRVPGRNYMRGQAASSDSQSNTDEGIPKYVHGQLLVRDLAKGVRLPLPLPLCRVLLLDSSSPVITKWERDRGDINFEKTNWVFPPATPRESEHYESEHQLIASGSMCGAHRTTSFQRHRNGALVRLTETQVIESDDSEKLIFTVSERLPRRGFSIKVRVVVRPFSSSSCEATILGEIRPVGRNMSNQLAVHRAFRLVLDELSSRYGGGDYGLLGGFVAVVGSMPKSQITSNQEPPESIAGDANDNKRFRKPALPQPFRSNVTSPQQEEKNESDMIYEKLDVADKGGGDSSGFVSFEDMLKSKHSGENHQPIFPIDRPSTPSLHLQVPDSDSSRRYRSRIKDIQENDGFEDQADAERIGHSEGDNDEVAQDESKREPVMIEVKPLPKIRLSLMPSPREEDEEMDDESSESPFPVSNPSRRKKKKPSKRSSANPKWKKPSKPTT